MNTQNNLDDLRTRLKERRRLMAVDERQRGALLIRGRLFTWVATNRTRLRSSGQPDAGSIAAFWSLDTEPELQPLLRQWAADPSLSVSLPVMRGPQEPLAFHLWTPDTPMRQAAYGIQEPQGRTAPAPDIILVPTLGYTRSGDRIGYGGGYYDRTLAALRDAGHKFCAVGIAWACGDLSGEQYQPAAHDQALDTILTDKGWAVPAPEL